MMAAARANAKSAVVAGVCLVLLYCVLATLADAATKIVARDFAAPQLFFFSGAIGAALSLIALKRGDAPKSLRPAAPWLLAARSAGFVTSCVLYFYAFKYLVFVEVFAFIALVPIFAALLSSPVLGESVRPFSWIALLAGTGGMLLMHPGGFHSMSAGHFFAMGGAVTGAVSMVLARLISRYERTALLQVFYPNLAICAVMSVTLPFVYQPMSPVFLAVILAYGAVLFAARLVLVLALERLPAYVVTPLINVQFVLMLAVGAFAFGETPGITVLLGSVVIITAGIMLVVEQYRASLRVQARFQSAPAR